MIWNEQGLSQKALLSEGERRCMVRETVSRSTCAEFVTQLPDRSIDVITITLTNTIRCGGYLVKPCPDLFIGRLTFRLQHSGQFVGQSHKSYAGRICEEIIEGLRT